MSLGRAKQARDDYTQWKRFGSERIDGSEHYRYYEHYDRFTAVGKDGSVQMETACL